MPFRKLSYVVLTLVLFAFAACTGGGEDSTEITSNSESFAGGILALSVAERVTVVDAKDSSGSSAAASVEGAAVTSEGGAELGAELAPYDIPGDTPYYTDKTRVWVAERSSEVFDSVNSILCFVSSLQYEAMVNRGDYVAQMDMSKCEDNTDASGRLQEGGDSSSGEDVPNYTRWVVNSSRADRLSPHIVKAWIDFGPDDGGGDGGGPGGIIFVRMTITESKSDTNPLGIFRLDYGGHPYLPDGVTLDTSTWIMRGFIEAVRDEATGEVLLYYASDESNGTDSRIHQAVLNRDEDAGEGVGSVYAYESKDEGGVPYVTESGYDFSYNDTHFLRGLYNTSTMLYDKQGCYSRYFFDEVVHRYGLYNSTGQRVEHTSGMMLKYNDGSQDYYGWIGYHGMWFPDQVNIVNGLTVYSQDYDKATNTIIEAPYETFVSGGKLIKYTQGTVQLLDIGNVPLNYHESGTDYIAVWNTGTQTFQKTSIVDYNSGTTTDIVDVDIDLTGYYNVTFWSESLGGSLRVDLMDAAGGPLTPDNTTTAITYNISVVYPGSEDPDLQTYGLACFSNCLNPTPGVINSVNPFHTKSTNGTINQQPGVLPNTSAPFVNAVTYSFDSARMQLVDDATGLDVILNETSLHTGHNSIQGGAMVINTPANMQDMECASGSADLCEWKLWDNAPVFYAWETGMEPWSRLAALKNATSGDFVSFDPPIKVEYVHNDPNSKYFGSKFFLEYAGFGDLWGIPGECVDPDTGDPVECGEGTWWSPSFSIPSGTELINNETAEPYLAKAMEKEQKMKQTSTMLPCAGFTLTHYTLPDIATQWQEPLIGVMPAIDAPPKVIDGELQGS